MRKSCSKVIIENFHEPCILFLLMEKPGYGYEIKEKLDKRCCCSVNIGNLYRCLASMQKHGYVTKSGAAKRQLKEGKPGPERKLYKITSKGKKLLKEWIEELEEATLTIKKLITNYKKHYETDKSK